MIRTRLSRRRFLGTCAAAAAWLVSACSGPQDERAELDAEDAPTRAKASQPTTNAPGTTSPSATTASNASQTADASATPSTPTRAPLATPTPTPPRALPLTVAVDPDLPEPLRAIAEDKRQRVLASVKGRAAEGEADIVITASSEIQATGGGSNTGPVVYVDYVAVVSRRNLVRDISFSDLQAVWNGGITDWGTHGSPDPYPILRVNFQGSAGPLPADKASVNVASLDELAELFIRERGAIAVIPLADTDYRFRALNLGGVNYFRPGDAVNPLRMALHVRPGRPLDATTLAQIQAALNDEAGPTPVSMTWTGDIIFGRLVHVSMVKYGDWAAPFRSIYPELSWADVTIGNLECSLSDSFETPTDPTTFEFKTATNAIEGLQLAQIDILSRANNHSFNFGPQGMQDTTDVLDAAGILHFGMGHDLEQARRAVVIERGGTTYAFLGYNGISDDWDGATPDSAGTAPLVDWMVVDDVRREVAAGHVVIPFFHWGTEYVYDPTEEQRYFAHIAIEAGAACVMGSHPHWVQAVETYHGKSIVYSLGNFVFDQEWSLETKQGMIAHMWMRGDKVIKLDLVPVLIEDYHKPRLMENWEAAPVLDHVWEASDWIIQNG